MKKPISILLAVLGVLAFSVPVHAGVVAGVSGTSAVSDLETQFVLHLGKGISTTALLDAYVTVDDTTTGYFTNFQLVTCATDTFTAGSCLNPRYVAWQDADGSPLYNVAMNGSGKRTLHISWQYHCVDNGSSCSAATPGTPITIASSSYVMLYFEGSSSNTVGSANRNLSVYGIATQLYDQYGTAIRCRFYSPAQACSGDMLTPYFLLSEGSLTDSQLEQYGGFTNTASAFPNWLVPTGFPLAPGASYGLTSSASLTGQDLGYFGNMLRDLALWLFSPWDESTNNAWINFKNSITVHVPFSYIAETYDILSGITVAGGSIPEWTYYGGSLIGSVSFFSASTITAYAPSGFLVALKALASAALWFAFLWHVYHEVRELWTK